MFVVSVSDQAWCFASVSTQLDWLHQFLIELLVINCQFLANC